MQVKPPPRIVWTHTCSNVQHGTDPSHTAPSARQDSSSTVTLGDAWAVGDTLTDGVAVGAVVFEETSVFTGVADIDGVALRVTATGETLGSVEADGVAEGVGSPIGTAPRLFPSVEI